MDTLFFILAKVVWVLFRPDSWIVLGTGLTCLALWRGWQRFGRLAASFTFAFVLLIAVVPVGDLILRPLEARYPASPILPEVTGIIILGGDVGRFPPALALARANPQAQIIFTGGSGMLRDLGSGDWSEAAVAQRFFAEQGVDPARLTFERASRNTFENATLTYAFVAPKPSETWVLVTSAFHMPRSLASFQAAGWEEIVPWPVDYRSRDFGRGLGWNLAHNLGILNTAVQEYLGILAYGATGR